MAKSNQEITTAQVGAATRNTEESPQTNSIAVEIAESGRSDNTSGNAPEIANVRDAIKCSKDVMKTLLYRFLFVAVIFFISLHIQAVFILLSEREYIKLRQEPLLDRLQQITPNLGKTVTLNTANNVIAIMFCLISIRILLLRPPAYACQMIIRYMALMATLYFIRGVFIVLTVIPSPDALCNSPVTGRSYIKDILGVWNGYFGKGTTCTDLVISGHTAGATIVTLLFMQNNPFIILNLIAVALLGFVYFALIVSKSHYTIDVLFGIFFSIGLHFCYICMMNNEARNILCRLKKEIPSKIKSECNPILARLVAKIEALEPRMVAAEKLMNVVKALPTMKIHPELKRQAEMYAMFLGVTEYDLDPQSIYKGTGSAYTICIQALWQKICPKQSS
ncbi:bifunctional Sphingomyelin synthase-like/Sphingomyelin synthase-like domain [Babesia duncani]|uniref:Bifunctional Sphingomyelin synthase-like/Sphingomyelin synthase-like domain n=1 Tax=Babesia duncani TaxID=323732 RepID=A0AAD9UNX1_9APIC|nr:bifunctional Sphingomyelin synthase-like/Sphingomyelin synthase-like domain [Babesia duncani]